MIIKSANLAAATLFALAGAAYADEIKAGSDSKAPAAFDIVETRIVTENGHAVFSTRVRADAGKERPAATGSSRARASTPMSGRRRSTAPMWGSRRIRESSPWL